MEVKEIIDPNIIKTNMTTETKEEALRKLANQLLDNDYISDVDGFIKDIYVREAQGQTGIGNYIAIPHGKSPFVKKIGVAIGINTKEIPWETLDGKGVKVIVLFVVGEDSEDAKTHLKLLSLFARKLGNDEVVDQLLKATTPEEVRTAFA